MSTSTFENDQQNIEGGELNTKEQNESDFFNENFMDDNLTRGSSPQSSITSEQKRELSEDQLLVRQQLRDKPRKERRYFRWKEEKAQEEERIRNAGTLRQFELDDLEDIIVMRRIDGERIASEKLEELAKKRIEDERIAREQMDAVARKRIERERKKSELRTSMELNQSSSRGPTPLKSRSNSAFDSEDDASQVNKNLSVMESLDVSPVKKESPKFEESMLSGKPSVQLFGSCL